MADHSNRVGQQMGNYRLISALGEGAFAEVYLGEHIYLKTQVAVKVLQEKMEAQSIGDFLKEGQMIAALRHPHILRVLDFGMEGATPFLVMEYALGGTLRQKHPRGSKVPLPTVILYAKQVAMALQYAHDQKIVHRDVKPENVLVEADGKIVLADFGIATPAHKTQSLSTQKVIGTVVYMAPEQIQGKPRPASDQYSLGIVVYEWLCGDRPFHGSFTEVCTQHMFAPPPPLREKMPTISPDLEQVIMTALAKDPKQRFASVQAFATALEQASSLGQSPPSASLPEANPLRLLLSLHSFITPLTNQSSQSTIKNLFDRPLPNTPEIHLPMSQAISHPSRRTVIAAGLAGLAGLMGGSIIWFAISRSPSLGTILYTYRGHSDIVVSVTWSPDGKRIASSSSALDPKKVQAWDAIDGTNLYTYKGHSDTVLSVAWSPDGKHIASASKDTKVQVWDAVDGTNLYTYKGHSSWVNSVAWSPNNNKRIASASKDTKVQIWNATDSSNNYTYTGHSKTVFSVAWSPDSKHIASGSGDMTVQVWDAVDGSNVSICQGHSNTVLSVTWSPDSKRIASSSGFGDNTVKVWDAINSNLLYTYTEHSAGVNSVAWSPNGKYIASASTDGTVQVWDAINGNLLYTYTGHSKNTVNTVAWSPDGKRIASGSDDNTVQVWVAS